MKKTPEDIKQLEKRISELQLREQQVRKNKPESEFVHASKKGLRIGTEMLSGVLVGAGIGYLLDTVFTTNPWFLVLFMFLGGGAGILNVYRFAQSEEQKHKE